MRKDEDVMRLGIDKSMSSYEDVDAFDVANFDKLTNNVIENAKESVLFREDRERVMARDDY